MKLEPRYNEIIGRMVIKRSDSKIVRIDETKVTKLVLVDAVGPGAAAAGINVGDVVLGKKMNHMVFDAGAIFRPLIAEPEIACFARELTPNELLMQTENGASYVPFDSPEAAQSLGVPPRERELAVA